MKKLNILILEDDLNLGSTLSDYLKTKSFDVTLSRTIKEAQMHFKNINYDLLMLDVGLPDGNGLDFAKWCREYNPEIPFLFCSALNDPELKTLGFSLGGEDYITKPFNLQELMYRLERIFEYKKNRLNYPEKINFGLLHFWPKKFQIQDANGNITDLSQKECMILQYLINHPDVVISRDELIEKIWGAEAYPTNRTVDNYIVKIRKWIESDMNKPLQIQSIRGVGYKLQLK